MTPIATLSITSTVHLSSGYALPRLGLGVYQNRGDPCYIACTAALKAGYRHIDCANIYRNEIEVGKAVRENKLELKREDIFVTSKVTSRYHGYDKTAKIIQKSLADFGFDYIDLYLIHDPLAGKAKRLATYQALLDAQAAGKIRTVGVSNYGVHHLEEIKDAGLPRPAVNQIELHPFCQQKGIVEYCASKSIVIQAYTPLVLGTFDHPVLVSVADKYNKGVAQILIRWSLQRGFVPLPKSAQPERIASNCDVFDFDLSSEDMARLDGLDNGKEGSVTWNPVDAP